MPTRWIWLGLLCGLLWGCATKKQQQGSALGIAVQPKWQLPQQAPAHSLLLVGNTGHTDRKEAKGTFRHLQTRLQQADSNHTLLFLGSSLSPRGFAGQTPERTLEEGLPSEVLRQFSGHTFFISGRDDWRKGLAGLEAQRKYVNNALQTTAFLPEKACGLDVHPLSDNLVLVVLDSEWFLQKWDKHIGINDDCSFRTREAFLEELGNRIHENQHKLTLLVMHHPLLSNGPRGGYYAPAHHLMPGKNVPAPGIGSIFNLLRKTSGVLPADARHPQYQRLFNQVAALVKGRENVLLVSAHEQSLQYIEQAGLKQIISGSATSADAAKAVQPTSFTAGVPGYGLLQTYENGEVWLSFFETSDESENCIFRRKIAQAPQKYLSELPKAVTTSITASIYDTPDTRKSTLYELLWGKHHRAYYGLPIEANILLLDSVDGGLRPVGLTADKQKLSLSLQNPAGKKYALHPLQWEAGQFLQRNLYKEAYTATVYKNSYAERLMRDFHTVFHPFAPLVADSLAQAIGLSHTRSQLFYIPKQTALENYNHNFGDALYLLEEQPSKADWNDSPDAIISTAQLLGNLHRDSRHQVDSQAYLDARLFDMLVGDWARRPEQWSWAAHHKGDSVTYRPIAHGHDRAFAKLDGLIPFLLKGSPPLRRVEGYSKRFAHTKRLNKTLYPLDVLLLKNTTETDWKKQARAMAARLTNRKIADAFDKLPPEAHDKNTDRIIKTLKHRRSILERDAVSYYRDLTKTAIITGTEGNDRFEVTRLPDGNTQVAVYAADSEIPTFSKDYPWQQTREIWLYGLDGDDVFVLSGDYDKHGKIRLVGGLGNDTYDVADGTRVWIYDYAARNNSLENSSSAQQVLSNRYELNEYFFEKTPGSDFTVLPIAGFNPDDGVRMGLTASLAQKDFVQAPFSEKHSLSGEYYFATRGSAFSYLGQVPFGKNLWGAALEARLTSPHFAVNYFGLGNETKNHQRQRGLDYNRVRMEQYRVAPSLQRIGRYGSLFHLGASFESVGVEPTEGRFVNEPDMLHPKAFASQQFFGLRTGFSYQNYDRPLQPTIGMSVDVSTDWTLNLSNGKGLPQMAGKLNFTLPLAWDNRLVLSTTSIARALLNNNFEFYQAAALGGDDNLRGYRSERFLGKSLFVQSTDIRLGVGSLGQRIAPMEYGLLGGIDAGRVWLDGEMSKRWHAAAGAGLWIEVLRLATAQLSYFKGSDPGRLVFGLGFAF